MKRGHVEYQFSSNSRSERQVNQPREARSFSSFFLSPAHLFHFTVDQPAANAGKRYSLHHCLQSAVVVAQVGRSAGLWRMRSLLFIENGISSGLLLNK